ncbi:MAG: transposase [Bacillota bacterium]
MPRTARKKSESNIYHVMIRGINKQKIFEDDGDHYRFLQILAKYRKETAYQIYAYCLMGNHVHLLIKEGNETISTTMKRLGTSYVYWYNWQYSRVGPLFQDRFRSEPVEDDSYFLTALRYIHQNPLQAGLVVSLDDYKWSSYREYFVQAEIVDVDFPLAMFDKDRGKALDMFKKFNLEVNNDQCLDLNDDEEERKTTSDKELKKMVLNEFGIELANLHQVHKDTQQEVLGYLKGLNSSSLRQLSRLTGITVGKIKRV